VQPERVPGPPVAGVPAAMASVTVDELVVTTLPYWSSTLTWGWVGKAAPAVDPVGWRLNASVAAAPALTVTEVETPGVTVPRLVSLAVMV